MNKAGVWSPDASPADEPAGEQPLVGRTRLLLAAAALAVVIIDPSETAGAQRATIAALGAYLAYCVATLIPAVRLSLHQRWPRWAPWSDVGWYSVLVGLSNGPSSIFFFGYFFAILTSSFRWGRTAGLRITAASALLFLVVGYETRGTGDFPLDRFLLRPIYLVVLGYTIAIWGENEIQSRRRLTLLRDVSAIGNPRLGVGRTVESMMGRVRNYFEADVCITLTRGLAAPDAMLRISSGEDGARLVPDAPPGLQDRLLSVPPDQVLRSWGHRSPSPQHRVVLQQDAVSGRHAEPDVEYAEWLASTLDLDALVHVPLRYRRENVGCLALGWRHPRTVTDEQVTFLLQVVDQVTPVVENIRLVDRLATEAATVERRRIAHNIHDGVIQPFIGLQLGLVAVNHALSEGRTADAARSLDRLLAMMPEEIASIRSIAGLLGDAVTSTAFQDAVRRHVTSWAESSGIRADLIDTTTPGEIGDRLAAEALHLVSEALSNIRRHADATTAEIRIAVEDGALSVRVHDDGTAGWPESAEPRTIQQRVAAVGGTTRVERTHRGSTLTVQIPL